MRRGHANLLCIVPILTDDPRRESDTQTKFQYGWTRLPVKPVGHSSAIPPNAKEKAEQQKCASCKNQKTKKLKSPYNIQKTQKLYNIQNTQKLLQHSKDTMQKHEIAKKKERKKQRERETNKERKKQRERETKKKKKKQRERETKKERKKQRERERDKPPQQ